MSQRGKSTAMSAWHGVAGSIAVLTGFARRAPVSRQDNGAKRISWAAPEEPGMAGHRRLPTNLTFVSLVAREWMRRRLGAGCALPRGGDAGILESESIAEPEWSADPDWAVQPGWAAESGGSAVRQCSAAGNELP